MLPRSSARWRAAAAPPRPSPPRPEPASKHVANRYVIEEELASGGMGTVYRVRDCSTGEVRALKRLKPEAAADKVLVEAFEREYQVLAGLNHPRIIQVFDYGIDADGPYYTMELLGGQDMRTAAPLPFRQACRCLRDVGTSLALLHARRLLHRDLSPRNARMTLDGRCKLIDFGALTAFGSASLVVGTPPAIPPEALDGSPLDQRSDLYSFGALAYWMLTGRYAHPARRVEELAHMWKAPPPPPSAFSPDVPPELDDLVLSLLSVDPRVRPGSIVEVISRLSLVAGLATESAQDVERLTESFLVSPRFVGRHATLEGIRGHVAALVEGRGGAVRIEAAPGMGRSRLLEEIGIHAQLAGAAVVRVDAGTHRDWSGAARALVLRLLDVVPRLARDPAERYRHDLLALGPEVESKLTASGSVPPAIRTAAVARSPEARAEATRGAPLDGWFCEISRHKPLLLAVDNFDDADDVSLGMLVALAHATADHPILLVVTEPTRREPRVSAGLATLRGRVAPIVLEGLSPSETRELCHSLFGDARNIGRFADWLYERTAGSPLHCIEISRSLLAARVIRYVDGMWSLPAELPDAELPKGLEEALSLRLVALGGPARGLAECLSLQRERPSMELCRQLVAETPDASVHPILDELARSDVLHADQGGYFFSSSALRDALLAGMDASRRENNHARLGEALARMAGPGDDELRIEAGWHLIQGGADLRGAEMIANATRNSATVRRMIANLHLAGRPIEAALKVYKRHRRSIYQRMPLLAALAHAGYYEHWSWAERYGDDALDACEDLSGVRTARSLRPFLGRWLSMVVGLLFAFIRFRLAPRLERASSFREMLVLLFAAVTTLTGTASLSLDIVRATRVTQVLELFSMLPKWMASVGIYEFCLGLREIRARAAGGGERLVRDPPEALRGPALLPRAPRRRAHSVRDGRALRARVVRDDAGRWGSRARERDGARGLGPQDVRHGREPDSLPLSLQPRRAREGRTPPRAGRDPRRARRLRVAGRDVGATGAHPRRDEAPRRGAPHADCRSPPAPQRPSAVAEALPAARRARARAGAGRVPRGRGGCARAARLDRATELHRVGRGARGGRARPERRGPPRAGQGDLARGRSRTSPTRTASTSRSSSTSTSRWRSRRPGSATSTGGSRASTAS